MIAPPANEWHSRPKGEHDTTCRFCGLPRGKRGEHRAIAQDERCNFRWMIRRAIGKSKYKYITVGRVGLERGGHLSGPSPETCDRISKITLALAMGATRTKAAQAVGIEPNSLDDYRRRHPAIWQFAYDKAMEKVAAIVRAQAGTDAVLEDPDSHVARASACQKWLSKRGETLFPRRDKPTLSSFYQDYYKPTCLGNAQPETIRTYDGVVRRWTIITGDPPLDELTTGVLVKFRDTIARMRGIQPGSKRSAASVRQIFIHLQAILDKAGPPGRRNRDAAGIIACPPYLKPPRITYKLPRIVPLDDLRDVYLAAVAMDIPRIPGIKPPAWWQALIVVALDTGLRRGDLLSLGMADIRWEELLIEIHQHKTGVGNLIPLHPVALKHLLAIRTDRRLVFEWPFGRTHFHTCLHRLQSAAGLPENRHFGLHAIRRTHATLMWQKNPEAARLVLGHGSDRTTRWHYVLGEGIVREAINALPQPWGLGEAV